MNLNRRTTVQATATTPQTVTDDLIAVAPTSHLAGMFNVASVVTVTIVETDGRVITYGREVTAGSQSAWET